MADVESALNLNKMKGKHVLVTGGTGFIGAHLVEALRGFCHVTVLSSSRKIEGIDTINVDLRNEADVIKNLGNQDFDVVFHLAANATNPGKYSAEDHLTTNSEGTRILLEACRRKGVERFIYSSSMSVFGPALYLPVDEKHPKLPRSFYGASKLLGENYCSEYRRFYGLGTVVLRYSAVYGPGQAAGLVCATFISNALNGEPLNVYENTGSNYDFVYVKDIVSANILAACKEGAVGEDFNIGSGEHWSIDGLAQVIRGYVPNVHVIHVSGESEGDKSFLFDISKASDILGYKPNYTLQRGLLEQIEYSRKQMPPRTRP
jgi:UDP-glucose 4-epimerase